MRLYGSEEEREEARRGLEELVGELRELKVDVGFQVDPKYGKELKRIVEENKRGKGIRGIWIAGRNR